MNTRIQKLASRYPQLQTMDQKALSEFGLAVVEECLIICNQMSNPMAPVYASPYQITEAIENHFGIDND